MAESSRGNVFTTWHETRTATGEASFFLPSLRPGMTLLDVGCGPGTITLGLAEVVSPGEATGVDLDLGRISSAQARATEAKIGNANFKQANAYELPFPDGSFDAVFANAVLEHLDDPSRALREAQRVLRRGGVIGLADTDHDGQFFSSPTPVLLEMQSAFDRWKAWQGGDFMIGKRLKGLLRENGFEQVVASASCRVFSLPEETSRWASLARVWIDSDETLNFLREDGAEDPEALLAPWRSGWEEWANDPDALVVQVRCEAVGWKP